MGKEDKPPGGGSKAPLSQPSGSARKMFWRSASWSASRSSLHRPEGEETELGDPCGGASGSSGGQGRRFPAPLTPRSQQNCKARSCLPPLQPLSIARRSLEEWPKASSDDIGEWPQPPTPSGERLKLDLSSIQGNPDKNGGLVRRDKIAFFDKECSKVADHIYLGGDAVAKDREILVQNGITHVLNCVGFVCPEYFKAEFVYRTLWLQDSPSEDITSILYDVFDYFEDVREQRGRVFVHCCQGVSRSTSLVIAYLMWREGQSFDDAFQYVKAARGIADPNMGFACQLLQCQKRVHAFPLSPSSLLRMYRLAPHSPYDPLHLVPKMLNDPSPSALDSRGAFIVHIPSAIYVWIGKSCEAIMERDARGAVCQIVRYERVQGPITVFKEGEEPAYFWDAFSNLLPLMDRSSNVKNRCDSIVKCLSTGRKVELYDVDFEIFQKAIKGGFVPPFASSENEHETHLPARESCWSVLRRKFAYGNLKDFVSAPRGTLSRVYSDSMMLVHFSKNILSPSSMSSSSSSPYLSPDSICSEPSSSSKHYSETSLDSPRAASGCFVSSTSSTFSNLSLHPSKTLPQPTSKKVDNNANNLGSKPSMHSNPSLPKNPPRSLAERRGSLSKALKLPSFNDNTKEPTLTFTSFNVNKGGDLYSSESCFVADDIVNSTEIGDVKEDSDRSSLKDSDSTRCVALPLICCLPSFKQLTTFAANCLDSESAFAIFFPSTELKKSHEMILHVWIGKSFDHRKCQIQLDSGKHLANKEELDWNKLSCDVITHFDLPENSSIKIIKEGEEPEGFQALLAGQSYCEVEKTI